MAPALSRLAQASKAHWGYPQAWLLEWEEQLTLTEDEIRNGLVFVALDLGAQAVDIDSDPNAEEFYLRQGAKRTGRTPAPVAGQERFLPRLSVELTTIP